MPLNFLRSRGGIAGLAAGLLMHGVLSAQPVTAPVGQVEFARGAGYAQSPGQNARILGKGLEFREGDTLSTSDSGSAIIRMQDGTRMTLRPVRTKSRARAAHPGQGSGIPGR